MLIYNKNISTIQRDKVLSSYVLLTLLLKSAVLSAVALVVLGLSRRFAARRVSAAARHAISLAAVAALALLPLLSVSLPAWQVAIAVVPPIPPTPFPPSEGEKGGVKSGSEGITAGGNAVPAASLNALPGSEAIPAPAPNLTQTPPFSPSHPEGTRGKGVGGIGGTTATALYATIAILLLLRIMVGHIAVWRVVRRAKPVQGASPDAAPVRASGEVAVPLTVGWGHRAVVVAPDGFGASVPAAQWNAVLAHETAHIRRGDYVWQALADIVCAVYFANPLVWLLARTLRDDAERAADDCVLSGGIVRPSEYAAHLLETARGLRSRRGVPAFAVTMARRSEVGARIGAILAANVSRVNRLSRPLIACVGIGCVAVAGVVAVLVPARGAASPETSPTAGEVSGKKPLLFRRTLSDGTVVVLESVARVGGEMTGGATWWKPDGEPINGPRYFTFYHGRFHGQVAADYKKPTYSFMASTSGGFRPPNRRRDMVLLVDGGKSVGLMEGFDRSGKASVIADMKLRDPGRSATVRLGIANGWTTLTAQGVFMDGKGGYFGGSNPFGTFTVNQTSFAGELTIARPYATERGATLMVSRRFTRKPDFAKADFRYVAETWDGKEIVCHVYPQQTSPLYTKDKVVVPRTPLARVKSFRMEARTYQWAVFTGVALQPQAAAPASPATKQNADPRGDLRSGTFRTVTSAPFTPGRTLRHRREDGKAVVFTVQVAPETDPSWTMGRKTAANAILQTHDTLSIHEERRIVLIEKDGTLHDLLGSRGQNPNLELDTIWKKAMGKPPVHTDRNGNVAIWTTYAVTFPKTWLPRLKEMRLETRSGEDVPSDK